MQNFGGQIRCIMGDVKWRIAYLSLHTKLNTLENARRPKSLNKQLSKRSPRKLDARCPHLFCSCLNFWPLLARAGRVCYKTKKLPIALVGSAQNVSGNTWNHSYNNLTFVRVSEGNCFV